jgi:hypothetical protein
MLRWMTPFLVAIFAAGTAAAAEDPAAAKAPDAAPVAAKPPEPPAAAKPNDEPPAAKPPESPAPGKSASSPAPVKRAGNSAATRRAASQLPPGLPRAHYNYRTTITPAKAPLYVRRGRTVVVEEESPGLLFGPTGIKAYAPRFRSPLLPGSSTLPGYYGTSYSYSYDGPYYGGPYEPYWNRLPYACGVYGYC